MSETATPTISQANEKPVKKTFPAKMIDAANDITAFASKDDSRWSLQGVRFTEKYAAATDGRICIHVPYAPLDPDDTVPFNGVPNAFEECTVPSEVVTDVIARADAGSSTVKLKAVKLALDGPDAVFAFTDLDTQTVVRSKLIDADFPNTAKVMETEPPNFTIKISAEILGRLCAYINKNCDRNPGIDISFSDPMGVVSFKTKLDDGREVTGALMPMRA